MAFLVLDVRELTRIGVASVLHRCCISVASHSPLGQAGDESPLIFPCFLGSSVLVYVGYPYTLIA